MGRTDDRRDEQQAFIEKLISVDRVAKVVKGGKRFSFSALVIVGDGKGKVGFARGKAREVADAVKKAVEHAKKNMIRVHMREGRTVHHDCSGMFGAGHVILRTAPSGTGIIAGGAMRGIFEALGMQDIVSKSLGSANSNNMVRATFAALQGTVSPRYIASKRGKKVSEITARRGY